MGLHEKASSFEKPGDSAGGPATSSLVVFPPFRLDLAAEQLWNEWVLVPLKPKALEVLKVLLRQPGRLVSHEELLTQIWGDVHLSEGVLKTQINDIRQALGDTARKPRFIETARRRGYRFIGHIEPSPAGPASAAPPAQSVTPSPPVHAEHFVGRDAELAFLGDHLAKADAGERQLVFVTGEAGVGKTALVSAFVRELRAKAQLLISWGQCIDQYGSGEPYLPIVDALRRLCTGPDAEAVAELVRRIAPEWIAPLPPGGALAAKPEVLRDSLAIPSPQRRLGQLAQTLEELARQRTVLLLMEDLHWADPSTLDLLTYLAQRPDPARLLVLGTYRPREAITGRLANLVHVLQARGRCTSLAVPQLNQQSVGDYLERRFGVHRLPPAVSELIYRRTEGNALFMVGIVDAWLERGLLDAHAGGCDLTASTDELARCIPDSFLRVIEGELQLLTPAQRRVLEAASVAGNEFSSAAVAGALSEDVVEVESICMRWARRGQFLRSKGKAEWRDGNVTECWEFLHVLYQQAIYDQIGAACQAQWHRRIAERLEEGYGAEVSAIAHELASHFQRGRVYQRTVHYLRIAGERALRQGAYQEAVEYLTRALSFVSKLPEDSDKLGIELDLRVLMGAPLRITKGYGAPEVEAAYARAAELCEARGATAQLLLVMTGMGVLYLVRGACPAALELGNRFLALAEAEGDSRAIAEAHFVLALACQQLGDHHTALAHADRVIAATRVHGQLGHMQITMPELGFTMRCSAALSHWVLGYPDRAQAAIDAVLSEARALNNSFAVAHALTFGSCIHRWRGELDLSEQEADEAMVLCGEQGFEWLWSNSVTLKGASLIGRGQLEAGLSTMRRGLAAFRATGARLYERNWLGVLAEGHWKLGDTQAALQLVGEALQPANSDHGNFWEPELLRLEADLLWAASRGSQATREQRSEALAGVEGRLSSALELARKHSAKLLELRVAMSLYECWREHGKAEQGRALLSEVYRWFSEGFDTADLRRARALLEA